MPTKSQTLPVRLPVGHISGASCDMNASIVITRWYFCSASTWKYLSNGICIWNSRTHCL